MWRLGGVGGRVEVRRGGGGAGCGVRNNSWQRHGHLINGFTGRMLSTRHIIRPVGGYNYYCYGGVGVGGLADE